MSMEGGLIHLNLDLRKAIISNISDNDQEQLALTIIDAIQNGEVKMLPGLGVLFELIWKQSAEDQRQDMIEALELGVKQSQVT